MQCKKSVSAHCNELFFVRKNGLVHDSEDLSVCPEHWERYVSPVEPPCGMCGHAPAFQLGQLETAESPLENSPKNSSPHPTVPLHIGQTGKKPLKGATTNFQWQWKRHWCVAQQALTMQISFRLHEATSNFLTKVKLEIFLFKRKRCFWLMCHIFFYLFILVVYLFSF